MKHKHKYQKDIRWIKFVLIGSVACFLPAAVDAAALLGWNFTGLSDQEVVSTTTGAGVEESILFAAPEMTIDTDLPDGFYGSHDWENTAVIDLESSLYFEFGISVTEPETVLNLSSLFTAYAGNSTFSSAGDVPMVWAYQASGQSGFTALDTFFAPQSSIDGQHTYDLSGVADLQGITSATFRFYTAGNADELFWSFGNHPWGFGEGETNSLLLGGEVAPIPEPSACALIAVGVGVLALARRRRICRREAGSIAAH